MLNLKIIATGKALPTQRVTSEQLDVKLNLAAGTVRKKSGIDYRHFAVTSDLQSDLAAAAIKDALANANVAPASIDLLIAANAVPEQALPFTAARIIEAAGLNNALAAFDVNASCLSFLVALHLAANLLQSNSYRRIVIVSAEIASRGLNWQDLESSVIFGDGAAAVIVERNHAPIGCEAYLLTTYPEGKAYCEIPAGGTKHNLVTGIQNTDFLFHMNGKAVFRLAARLMDAFLAELFQPLDYAYQAVDLIIPHQASHLSMQHINKRLGFAADKIVNIYPTHGNQIAASLPTALHEALVSARLKTGQKALLLGTAAGLSIGGMVLSV